MREQYYHENKNREIVSLVQWKFYETTISLHEIIYENFHSDFTATISSLWCRTTSFCEAEWKCENSHMHTNTPFTVFQQFSVSHITT